MHDFRNTVKHVMAVFLVFFVALISYIAYFQAFKANDIANSSGNKRILAEKNKIIRGVIYDRNGNPLATSEKTGTLTQSRTYLGGAVYAHALGYSSDIYGTTGLEEKFDDVLTSYSSTSVSGIKGLFEDFSIDNLVKSFKTRGDEKEEKQGNGIITTLDPTIQQTAYDALGSNKGAVVALNPTTGEVLAMASTPSYDPNDLDQAMADANSDTTGKSILLNRAVNGLYPPGSTFKTITTASALENMPGVTSRTFNDTGVIQFNSTQSLRNAGGAVNGPVDLERAFVKSSNVVYGTLAMELGNKNLKDTAESFGFNKDIKTTGFSLSKSQFPTLENYEKGMIAQCGIGQSSILATPMQMALVASTIANNGVMMEPTLVNKIVDADGNTKKEISYKKYGQVISADIASTIKGYMQALVEGGGLSGFDGLSVAGKTGTADHTEPDGSLGTPHSWFIGISPVENPKVVVAVIVEEGNWGAKTAAPAAAKVIRAALGEN